MRYCPRDGGFFDLFQRRSRGRERPRRLGWWRTELTDPDAGGDFLARLVPRTHAWAALGAAREAATRVDEAARRRAGAQEAVWTLFHFGVGLNERLAARIGELRRSEVPPAKALGAALGIRDRFDRSSFAAWLTGLARETEHEVVPGGRRVRARPASPADAARRLAASLVPLGAEYPLPFLPIKSP